MIAPERTLIIIKHDAVARGLVGKVIDRFEKVGLKMVDCKMALPSEEMAKQHYDNGEEWRKMLGVKTLETFQEFGLDAKEALGTDDPAKLGQDVFDQLVKYLSSGPAVVMVWEGVGAIAVARKLVGKTTPAMADVGTLRGDFTHDSQMIAPFKGRALQNLLHASGTKEEADREIALWFGAEFRPEQYERVDAVFF